MHFPSLPAPVEVPRAAKAPLTLLLQKKYLAPTALLTILWVTQTIGFFGYSSWAPTLLAKEGFSVENSIFYVALTTVGAPLGSYLASLVTDRFERKWCLVVFGSVIAVCGLLYGLTFNPVLIVLFGFLVNLFERGYTALAYAYSPELFDTNGPLHGHRRLLRAGPPVQRRRPADHRGPLQRQRLPERLLTSSQAPGCSAQSSWPFSAPPPGRPACSRQWV